MLHHAQKLPHLTLPHRYRLSFFLRDALVASSCSLRLAQVRGRLGGEKGWLLGWRLFLGDAKFGCVFLALQVENLLEQVASGDGSLLSVRVVIFRRGFVVIATIFR